MIVFDRVTIGDILVAIAMGATTAYFSTTEAGCIAQVVVIVGCAICRTLGARDDA